MSTPRRHSRTEILKLAASMAQEFEARAQASGASPDEIHTYLRTAHHMRELLSIADGRRSDAYWTRRRSVAAPVAA